jgi:hypothetical protein
MMPLMMFALRVARARAREVKSLKSMIYRNGGHATAFRRWANKATPQLRQICGSAARDLACLANRVGGFLPAPAQM